MKSKENSYIISYALKKFWFISSSLSPFQGLHPDGHLIWKLLRHNSEREQRNSYSAALSSRLENWFYINFPAALFYVMTFSSAYWEIYPISFSLPSAFQWGKGSSRRWVCLGMVIVTTLCCFISYILFLKEMAWMLGRAKITRLPKFPMSGLTNELKSHAYMDLS